MRRTALCAAWLVAITGCRSDPNGPRGAASAAMSGSATDDVAPAIEVTAPKPAYALGAVTDKQLERLVARAGWTPTIVGKSPASDTRAVLRVAAFKKADDKQLDAVVFLRCGAPDKPHEPGEAYYKDGTCEIDAVVRLGIRAKSSESKRLLEALLGAPPS